MRNKILTYSLFAIGIMAICMFAILPLFHAGYFVMHDDEQIARLQQMYLVLSQGQIPPRWIPDLGFGYGYPLFNFYPPLVYYVGSFFHTIGFSFITSTKLVMGLGFFLSAGAMFLWVRKHYGIIAGFFAALLYTYAPYHSVDLYVRGALSEFFSWIWVPLIFWSLDLLFEKPEKKYMVLFGIFFAFLMLSHSLVMLQFGSFFLLYTGVLFWRKIVFWRRYIVFLLGGILLGLGLSAYFWIPSLAEKQFTLVDSILITQLANYAIHFVCPVQLWSSPWGYGGSVAGCVDGLSFQIGKIQAIVGAGGILLSIFYITKKRQKIVLLVSVLFLCSIFLTLPFSQVFWNIAKPFWYIQFPWRYLLFVAVFSAFLGGALVACIKQKFGRKIAIITCLILSFLAIYQVRNYFQPLSYRYVLDKQLTSLVDIQWRVSRMSYEYVPKEVATRLSLNKTTELAIDYSQIPLEKSFTALTDNMQVKELENLSQLKKYSVNVYNTKTLSEGILQINTYNFPGWEVWVDGQKSTHFIKNKLDLIDIALPEGQHTVVVELMNTPVRAVANIVTGVSLIALLGAILWRKKHI
ncbi:MAG TPA: 6-pyruvoyl-tetrahydropterin synthase-related protein [Patescibacteria group bacterium]|nr:6-pyruvoyl-tetrahydropterin synthase-related protein [Patescibacteria group bacterium]